jgi:hypothetical protein
MASVLRRRNLCSKHSRKQFGRHWQIAIAYVPWEMVGGEEILFKAMAA